MKKNSQISIMTKSANAEGVQESRTETVHQFSHTGTVAVCCSELQCVAVNYSVLQCVVACCSMLQRVSRGDARVSH